MTTVSQSTAAGAASGLGAKAPLSTNPKRDFGDQLSFQIWTTRGARFNAHRRLLRQNEWSQRAQACLAVYVTVLAWAAAMPVFGISAEDQARLAVATGALSLLIVVFSLLESQRNYVLRAERLHACAVELGALASRVDAAVKRSGGTVTAELESLSDQYHTIIRQCQENHDEIDNIMFRCSRPSDFNVHPFMGFVHNWVFAPARLYAFPVLAVAVPVIVGVVYVVS